jgi:hypothetical protein
MCLQEVSGQLASDRGQEGGSRQQRLDEYLYSVHSACIPYVHSTWKGEGFNGSSHTLTFSAKLQGEIQSYKQEHQGLLTREEIRRINR